MNHVHLQVQRPEKMQGAILHRVRRDTARHRLLQVHAPPHAAFGIFRGVREDHVAIRDGLGLFHEAVRNTSAAAVLWDRGDLGLNLLDSLLTGRLVEFHLLQVFELCLQVEAREQSAILDPRERKQRQRAIAAILGHAARTLQEATQEGPLPSSCGILLGDVLPEPHTNLIRGWRGLVLAYYLLEAFLVNNVRELGPDAVEGLDVEEQQCVAALVAMSLCQGASRIHGQHSLAGALTLGLAGHHGEALRATRILHQVLHESAVCLRGDGHEAMHLAPRLRVHHVRHKLPQILLSEAGRQA
mmetsp:Transcript_106032/g.236687  ORF Transcript_106032/g.236687 Transcript_106032/m.236687 type:complete len:300 (+) Transcript_106032:706-1605(+)